MQKVRVVRTPSEFPDSVGFGGLVDEMRDAGALQRSWRCAGPFLLTLALFRAPACPAASRDSRSSQVIGVKFEDALRIAGKSVGSPAVLRLRGGGEDSDEDVQKAVQLLKRAEEGYKVAGTERRAKVSSDLCGTCSSPEAWS